MADVDMTDVPVKKAVGKSKDDGKKRFEVKKVGDLLSAHTLNSEGNNL